MSLTPFPSKTPPIAQVPGLLVPTWQRWLTSLASALASAPSTVQTLSFVAQSASLTATTLTIVPATGTYQVSSYLQITRAATVSSSATVTIGWITGGVVQATSGAAVTGNTTATNQSLVVFVTADANTAITYAVAYASSGATAMQFSYTGAVVSVP
jgi:hypothetical protein